jgi:hypothetical protein
MFSLLWLHLKIKILDLWTFCLGVLFYTPCFDFTNFLWIFRGNHYLVHIHNLVGVYCTTALYPVCVLAYIAAYSNFYYTQKKKILLLTCTLFLSSLPWSSNVIIWLYYILLPTCTYVFKNHFILYTVFYFIIKSSCAKILTFLQIYLQCIITF